MDKQTYKQLIKSIAKEMQETVTPDRKVSAGQLMYARIAVAKMTEAIRDFLIDYAVRSTASTQSLDQYLKERGLIPDNGQEADSIGTKFIKGSFEFADGKLSFTCSTHNRTFNEVLEAITKLRDECQRQIDNRHQCPFHDNEKEVDNG